MPVYTQRSILNQLDSCAKQYAFPMLDNGYVYLADVNISVYRDLKRWALVFEIIGVNNRLWDHERLENCLYCFGNCLTYPPGLTNGGFYFPTSDGPDGATFDSEDDWCVRDSAQAIRVREVVLPIPRDPAVFAVKGIEREQLPRVTIVELLRALLPEHRDLFLATSEEIQRHIPADLPRILTLREWEHPDLVHEEVPSQITTFQMLADVLKSGDIAHYSASAHPNTHWRFWPLGGAC